MRWGPGPVFVHESLAASRRWQIFAIRSIFVFALLLTLAAVWGDGRLELSEMGARFYNVMARLQISFLLLAAPAATAGSVCLDRARGTLTHMLVTDLGDGEIVVGKLLARLAPVLAFVLAALPVLEIATLLGGIVPEAIVTLFLVSVGVASLGCALAMAVSARVKKSHEVLMVVYTVWFVWLLGLPTWELVRISTGGPPAPEWVVNLNPFVLIYLPYHSSRFSGVEVAIFLVVTLGATAFLALFATRTLRSEVAPVRKGDVIERWSNAAGDRIVSWFPAPSLDGNPVLWREWHRNRPSRVAQRVWFAYIMSVIFGTLWGLHEATVRGIRPGPNLTVIVNAFSVTFGLLFLSVTAPTALSEERVRGSLDVLLTTPLSTASIVMGKWWGAFRMVPKIAIFPAIGAFFFAIMAPQPKPIGRVLEPIAVYERVAAAVLPVAQTVAYGALVSSVGVALATFCTKPGRAVTLSVSLYLFATIGSILFVEGVAMRVIRAFSTNLGPSTYVREVQEGLLTLSPFVGQLAPNALVNRFSAHHGITIALQSSIILLALLTSAFVLAMTVACFDRCLGRVGDSGGRRSSRQEPLGSSRRSTVAAAISVR